jgi:hypothetical protein
MTEFDMGITVDTDQVIYFMSKWGSGLDYDELIEFVKDLDLAQANWEFTEELYRYFKAQHKIYKAECE